MTKSERAVAFCSCMLVMPLVVFGILEFVLRCNFVIFALVVMALVGLGFLIGFATDIDPD